GAAGGQPGDERRTAGDGAVGGLEDLAGGRPERLRVRGDLVVHRAAALGRPAELVRHDVVAVGQFRHGRHAGTEAVGRVGHVVDDRAPVHAVRGDLVHQLLAVVGVALVGVVDDQLAAGDQEERLPDGGVAVGGVGLAAGGDVADEGPGQPAVGAGVH